MADALYDFLPGSGRTTWRGHVTFGTVAAKVGVGDFWQGGSKKPAIATLLARTLEYRRGSFQKLILEIVRCSIIYREKENRPITAAEIDGVNGHILELGYKFPELWDTEFRASLERTTAERARQHVQQAQCEQNQQTARNQHAHELFKLKERFF